MNESECVRLRQQAEHLQRKLTISEQELNELSEAAKVSVIEFHRLGVVSDEMDRNLWEIMCTCQ